MTSLDQATWMAHVARGLVAAGVSDVVVSPGSRSTALLGAMLQCETLRFHRIVDERSAGFFAMGLARAGRVPALLCTSGTAAAHYLPAVMEASAAELPIVVVTANRPPEAHDMGANQTIEQQGMFARYVRAELALGGFFPSERSLRSALLRTMRTALAALHPRRGPVHIDVPARKPLEMVAEGVVPRIPKVFLGSDDSSREWLCSHWNAHEKPALLLGPMAASSPRMRALLLALEARGVAIWGELSASVSSLPAEALLRAKVTRPDFIVHIGMAPTGPKTLALLDATPHCVMNESSWVDPEGTAEAFFFGAVADHLQVLLNQEPKACWSVLPNFALDSLLSEGGHAQVLRAAAAAIREDAVLVVGNSMTIRLLDEYAASVATQEVTSQRGVSGIDGFLAGIAGLAATRSEPVVGLLGDLTLLHDLGSLALLQQTRIPVVVVVFNDNGGRIFSKLPVADRWNRSAVEEYFAMPHGLRFEHAALQFGLRYHQARDARDLTTALSAAQERAGTTLVEVALPQVIAAEELYWQGIR